MLLFNVDNFELNIFRRLPEDLKRDTNLIGMAYLWDDETKKGVEYNIFIDEDGEDYSAIYRTIYNKEGNNIYTDSLTYEHYYFTNIEELFNAMYETYCVWNDLGKL